MSQLNHLFPKLYFWKEAEKDWHKLDGSQKKFIAKGLLRIQENGANIGEELGNKRNSNLCGYRKLKFKANGLRIVYKIVDNVIEVAEIIVIGNRADAEVYDTTQKRILKKDK